MIPHWTHLGTKLAAYTRVPRPTCLRPTRYSILFTLVAFTLAMGCAPDDLAELPSTSLEQASTTPVILRRATAGQATFLSASVPVPANLAGDAVAGADWFLQEFGPEIGIDVEHLEMTDAVTDGESSGVGYAWSKDGVSLFNIEIRVVLFGDEVSAVFANLPEDLDSVSTVPTVTEEEAWATDSIEEPGSPVEAELVLLNEGLFHERVEPTVLAWKLTRNRFGNHEVRFVDAQSGLAHPFWFSETAHIVPDVQTSNGSCDSVDYAYLSNSDVGQHFSAAHDFFYDRYAINSWDDSGARISVVLDHRERKNGVCEPTGSHWDPNTHSFGISLRTNSLDVVAHEYTHAVVGH